MTGYPIGGLTPEESAEARRRLDGTPLTKTCTECDGEGWFIEEPICGDWEHCGGNYECHACLGTGIVDAG